MITELLLIVIGLALVFSGFCMYVRPRSKWKGHIPAIKRARIRAIMVVVIGIIVVFVGVFLPYWFPYLW